MKAEAPRLPHIRCPHCGGKAFARSAGKTNKTYREVYYCCRNKLSCGHVFIVEMAITRTVHQSLRPNPDIRLPVAPPAAPANDDFAQANDNGVGSAGPSSADLPD